MEQAPQVVPEQRGSSVEFSLVIPAWLASSMSVLKVWGLAWRVDEIPGRQPYPGSFSL